MTLTLYQVKNNNPYYFWAVMSVVLQSMTHGKTDEDRAKNLVMLQLAERMIAKIEEKMSQEQEAHLYLMVLEMQGKFAEAIRVLDVTGEKMGFNYLDFADSKMLEYLTALESWPEIGLLTECMLKKNPDQWNVLEKFVESAFKSESGNNPDRARNFIKELQVSNSNLRGPILAEILLEKYAENEDRILDLMLDYFQKFGGKPCCFSDLRDNFQRALNPDNVQQFLKTAEKSVGFDESGIPCTVNDIHKHVCLLQLERTSGAHQTESAENLEHLAEKLRRIFDGCQYLVKDMNATEQRPSDLYAFIAGKVPWP